MNKSKPKSLLLFLIITFQVFEIMGLNGISHKIPPSSLSSKDSLKMLELSSIDFGLNRKVNFWGTNTYDEYKNKIRKYGEGGQHFSINYKETHVEVEFTYRGEVERIVYYSLKGYNQQTDVAWKTQHYKFKLGDSLSYCLKKLKGVEYKIINQSYKEVKISIHGLLIAGIPLRGVPPRIDEYYCIYFFKDKKLSLIDMNYDRDHRGNRANFEE